MKLRSILLFIVGILVAQVVLIVFGFYNLFPSFDVPMHFLGGFSMALLGIYIHHAMTDKHHLKGHPDWYHILFVLGFVMLIGVACEFHEYVLDNTAVLWWGWKSTQLSLSDTIGDLFMDAIGGVMGFIIAKKHL